VNSATAELIKLGEATLARVTADAADGLSLLHCQLAASPFHQALARKLPASKFDYRLDVAAGQGVSPLIAELQLVLVMLRAQDNHSVPTRDRTAFRVIEGGRT
jgi:hypothetical protein